MKILIATDGSEYGTAAVEECCRLFPNLEGHEIKVVSAFEKEYTLAAEPFALSPEYIQQIAEAAEKQAEYFVQTAADLIKKRSGDNEVNVKTETVVGPAEKLIVETASSWGADLIIVGSHGRGFWGRMLGSVSDAVIHHAPCSVMVVRRSHE